MKIVKYMITVGIAFLCICLGAELFQSHAQGFTNQFFYFEVANEDRENMHDILVSAAREHASGVFAVERKVTDAYHARITVYGTEEALTYLHDTQSISAGTHTSLFSGSTEIVLRPFSDIIKDESIERFYFIGSKAVVSSVRNTVYSQIAASYFHREPIAGNEQMLYGIWAVSLCFLLFLTWLDIQFQRKENFLKISMGQSVGHIIARNIYTDLLVNTCSFVLIFWIASKIIFVCYGFSYVCIAITVFLLLNSALYLTLLRYDYKEILCGANINERTLANAYLLKACVMILLVVSLSCNLTLIGENLRYVAPFEAISRLEDYQTLTITPTEKIQQSNDELERIYSELYFKACSEGKVFLATSNAELKAPIVVVNDISAEAVSSNPNIFKDSLADFVVYVPQEDLPYLEDEDIQSVATSTAYDFFGLEDCSYDVIPYGHNDVIYFDLREEVGSQRGFELVSDPIIVYCNLSQEKLEQIADASPLLFLYDGWTNVIFHKNFSVSQADGIGDISYDSVVGQCEQYRASTYRIILICSILSAFLLLLSILLVSIIVKTEYMINAKSIALKKILGYSILSRNRGILLLNIFAVFIGFLTGVILSKMYDISSAGMMSAVSVGVLIFDTVLILCYMSVWDRRNVAHILKGGSL